MEHIMSGMIDNPLEKKQFLEKLVKPIYSMFVDHVEKYRKDKFKISREQREKLIYNSDLFLGKKSVELGLADQLGGYVDVL